MIKDSFHVRKYSSNKSNKDIFYDQWNTSLFQYRVSFIIFDFSKSLTVIRNNLRLMIIMPVTFCVNTNNVVNINKEFIEDV